MSEQVTRITRFHQLADSASLLGDDRKAQLCRNAAVSYGICVLTIAERYKEQKEALDQALEWLRNRDYEMYRTVTGTLDESRATKEAVKQVSIVTKLNGGRRWRR